MTRQWDPAAVDEASDPDAAAAFAAAFDRLGGTLAIEKRGDEPGRDLFRELRWHMREMIRMGREVPPPQLTTGDIYLDFVDNATFNAAAIKLDGHELIGIYSGAIFLIYNYFSSFLSDPSVLPQIGNPSVETKDEETLAALRDRHLSDIAPRRPLDPTRNLAASRFAWGATCLLFLHEARHHMAGHLEFMRDEFALRDYIELPALPLSPEECAIRRALEFDADLGAAGTHMRWWLDAWGTNRIPELEALPPALSWCICVAMLYKIMDAEQMDRPFQLATHPPAIARWLYTAFTANQANYIGVSIRLDDAFFEAGQSEVVRWWNENKLPVPKSANLSSVRSAIEHVRSTYDDHGKIMPRVRRFAEHRASEIRNRYSNP